ncbi:MAG: NTP transferase domain-containing protein, partial [Candidatus Omnitrophica bacterium]|nr:NTP transferase domain-containing protein [Candidatus Omnitrophota bacterium]
MKNIAMIILAAGEGTRMKSSTPKVLHPICGKPMIKYPIDAAKAIGVEKIIAVVGHKSDLVEKSLPEVKCVKQDRLLGTGDAVMKTQKMILKDKNVDSVLILCGDTPLLTPETLNKAVQRHLSARSACTLLTADLKNPTGYGRIVRSGSNKIIKIVEEIDASIYDKVIEEINVGVYCFDKNTLFKALESVRPDNRKKEYYLTDVIEILAKSNSAVDSVSTDDPEEFLGVNTRKDLIRAEQVVRQRTLDRIMEAGVTIVDPR